MFKKWREKLESQWKAEWWLKEASNLAKQYESKRVDLERRFTEEFKTIESEWNYRKELLQKRVGLEEESVSYRIKNLEDRGLELIKADNDLKTQIKVLEAKASPSSVWTEAFSMGVSKTWDMLLPVMTGNLETLKKKIYEDATFDALERMRKK